MAIKEFDYDWFLEENTNVPFSEEVDHLTHSRRHYQPKHLVGVSIEKALEKNKGKQKIDEIMEEDGDILNQLKKTQA